MTLRINERKWNDTTNKKWPLKFSDFLLIWNSWILIQKSNIMESTEWIQMIEKSTGMEIENADNSSTRKPG